MTNTYPDDAPYDLKFLEEVRCLRCVSERILRVMDEGLFVDYQLEKFGKAPKSSTLEEKTDIIRSIKRIVNSTKYGISKPLLISYLVDVYKYPREKVIMTIDMLLKATEITKRDDTLFGR